MGAELNIQRFESKRQVVEAVQLTASADWEAIAKWCGGSVGVTGGVPVCISLGPVPESPLAELSDWIVRVDSERYVLIDEDFHAAFQPAPVSDDIAGEIRQTLEGTTPGPWEWVEDGDCDLYAGDSQVLGVNAVFQITIGQADMALIAAAPVLLARAADRIEQLEAIIAEIGKAFDGAEGVCEVCGTWVHTDHVLMNNHRDSCELLAAINIAKEGA